MSTPLPFAGHEAEPDYAFDDEAYADEAGFDVAADLPEQLLLVVNDLIDVIEEENAILGEGVPASLVSTIERKLHLSDTYEDLCADMGEFCPDLLAQEPDFADALVEAVTRLREVTTENLARLDAAMNASRQRVEAVMDAMRETVRENAPYGPDGDVPVEDRLPPIAKDFHI